MAEVKLKNGYLKISNSLFDNLYFRDFTKYELVVISLILRLSYGFNKKYAIIKPKGWFCVCGLYKADITKTIKKLKSKNVIKNDIPDVYSINKNYDEWDVRFSKKFDVFKFITLKAMQYDENANEKVSNLLTKSKENTNEKVSEILTESKQNTNPENIKVSENLTKGKEITNERLVNNLPTQDENASDTNADNLPKDIKTINTNNNIYIYKEETENKKNNKNFDPYFNNPVVEKFKEEYTKIFKKHNCYLDNIKINKLTEIYVEDNNFINQIPEILNKFSKIRFSNGIGAPTLKWLINEGAWAGILNGEYDQYIVEENSESEETGWKL